jgi:5,10-methylenetetrahydrofolate reductase
VPITSVAMIERMAVLSGTRLPAPLLARLQAHEATRTPCAIRVEHATQMCGRLLAEHTAGLYCNALKLSLAGRRGVIAGLSCHGRLPDSWPPTPCVHL